MPTKAKNQPFADLADIAEHIDVFGAGIATLAGIGASEDDIEKELTELPHLQTDLRFESDAMVSHEGRDVRQAQTAVEHIGRIPDHFEAFHLVTSGRYALWNMVPAIAELAAPTKIADLHLATLGFSKANITDLVTMLDAGEIAKVTLLCSHYFKGTSGDIWTYAQEELLKRRTVARYLSIRTHAKIMALKLADGRTVTIEASANLRSCKNIEQISIFGHPGLYEFHAGWIDGLFNGR